MQRKREKSCWTISVCNLCVYTYRLNTAKHRPYQCSGPNKHSAKADIVVLAKDSNDGVGSIASCGHHFECRIGLSRWNVLKPTHPPLTIFLGASFKKTKHRSLIWCRSSSTQDRAPNDYHKLWTARTFKTDVRSEELASIRIRHCRMRVDGTTKNMASQSYIIRLSDFIVLVEFRVGSHSLCQPRAI